MRSLQFRLTLSHLFVALACVAIMLLLTFVGYFSYLNTNWAANWARDYAVSLADVLGADHADLPALDAELSTWFVEDSLAGFDIESAADAVNSDYYWTAYLDEGESMLILSPEGLVVASSDPDYYPVGAPFTTPDVPLTFPRPDFDAVSINTGNMHVGLSSIWNTNGDFIGWMYFEGSGDDVAFLLGQIARTLAVPTVLAALLALFVSAMVGVLLARFFGKRLRAISSTAAAFAAGNYTQRVALRGQDEFSLLGGQFNRMADQLQTQMVDLHDFATIQERNRLARELHDAVKQQLFSLNLTVGSIQSILTSQPEIAQQRLKQVVAQSQSIHQEIDTIINQLRPPALQDQGLASALQSLTETWQHTHQISVQYAAQAEREVPVTIEQSLYRIAQEALQNIGKHAHATAVEVHLVYTAADVTLTVQDNGQGFDPAAKPNKGLGVQSMHERVAPLGGAVTVKSAPDNGTIVVARVPITIAI